MEEEGEREAIFDDGALGDTISMYLSRCRIVCRVLPMPCFCR